MPPANLPEAAKKIYNAAEESAKKSTCKDSGDRKDECAARVAWSAVKNKYKKVGDNWVPKADVEFSFAITKSSFDKVTNTRRWRAVASDTAEDNYKDNMTMELFDSFVDRIEANERPPEQYCSGYWQGGNPYLSLAHYPDLDGKAVAGMSEDVFRDGKRLKALGIFSDTKLGHACFEAVNKDLYSPERSGADDKVRISIAFLDYKHKHKSNGFEFQRKSLDEICPECVKEVITKVMDGTEPKGKEFLDGHLIHLALTRVPVNGRTDITVERSMTTQKEDALSIIKDEELFEETIEQELSKITKSEALVVKSEEAEGVALVEEGKHDYDGECPDDMSEEECRKMMEKRKKSGKKTEKSEVFNMDVNELREVIKSVVAETVAEAVKVPEPAKEVEAPAPHILDTVLGELKATYDKAIEQKLDPNATLAALQQPMEVVGRAILGGVQEANPQAAPDVNAEVLKALSELTNQVALLKAQQTSPAPQMGIPPRRNISPSVVMNSEPVAPTSTTPGLQSIVRKSVGLQ